VGDGALFHVDGAVAVRVHVDELPVWHHNLHLALIYRLEERLPLHPIQCYFFVTFCHNWSLHLSRTPDHGDKTGSLRFNVRREERPDNAIRVQHTA